MSGINHFKITILCACPTPSLVATMRQAIQQRLPLSTFHAVHDMPALQATLETITPPYDVLIIDNALPKLNYPTIAASLQLLPHPQPIIVLGAIPAADTPNYFPTGIVNYMQKPVEMSALANQMYGYAYFISRANHYVEQLQVATISNAKVKQRTVSKQHYVQLVAEARQLVEHVLVTKTRFGEKLARELPLHTIEQLSELLNNELATTRHLKSQQNLDKICTTSVQLLEFVQELQTLQATAEHLSTAQIQRLLGYEKMLNQYLKQDALH